MQIQGRTHCNRKVHCLQKVHHKSLVFYGWLYQTDKATWDVKEAGST